jgi:hypothetical protein
LTRSAAPRIPDLFIVGAPKSGTTSLYRYLAHHPDVHMSPIKEPHFFGSDLRIPGLRQATDLEQYLTLFADATDARAVGEASTWYLASRLAAEEIHAFNSDAAVVVMLRNPIEMSHSLHSQCLKAGIEDERDFGRALALEDARRHGRSLPGGGFHQALLYTDAARYSDQVERYQRVFGRERVHVVLFDDLRADADGTFLRLVEWLGLDPVGDEVDGVHNPNRMVRSLWARNLLERPPSAVRRAVRTVVPGSLRPRIRDLLFGLNNPVTRRSPLDGGTRRRLAAVFRPDIQRLQLLIGRDLGPWLDAAG